MQKQLSIQRRGGEITLCQLAQDFADKVPTELPALWENITKYLNGSTGMSYKLLGLKDFTREI